MMFDGGHTISQSYWANIKKAAGPHPREPAAFSEEHQLLLVHYI